MPAWKSLMVKTATVTVDGRLCACVVEVLSPKAAVQNRLVLSAAWEKECLRFIILILRFEDVQIYGFNLNMPQQTFSKKRLWVEILEICEIATKDTFSDFAAQKIVGCAL